MYLSFFKLSVLFWGQPGQQSLQFCKFSFFFFFLVDYLRSGILAEIGWSVCMSKSQRSLCVSFSRTDAGLCIYHLFVWSNLNFLQWITLPTLSCLVLYSFGSNLLHLLIVWLMVSSLSPHNPYLLFYCVLSILALISLFLWHCLQLLFGEIQFLS